MYMCCFTLHLQYNFTGPFKYTPTVGQLLRLEALQRTNSCTIISIMHSFEIAQNVQSVTDVLSVLRNKMPRQAACLWLAVALPWAEAFIGALSLAVLRALAIAAALPLLSWVCHLLPKTIVLHLATKPNFSFCCCAHWVLKPA